ncbi:hypothetical protein L0M90_13075, partial [[Ruminococcus] torques]|uniref:hypothetical protein n=1 Tax=[Ruminococcus] torques TaxID=33039 RepID=UPI001EE0F662
HYEFKNVDSKATQDLSAYAKNSRKFNTDGKTRNLLTSRTKKLLPEDNLPAGKKFYIFQLST